MSRAKPLTDLHRQTIWSKMEKLASLTEVTREAGVVRVVEYLLDDKSALEQYLTTMASTFTQQRRQISHSMMILSIFHYERSSLSLYAREFKELLTSVVEREQEIQRRVFIADNHLQIDIDTDVWKLYERHGDILRLKTIDFTKILCSSLRYEMKHYLRHSLKMRGKSMFRFFAASTWRSTH